MILGNGIDIIEISRIEKIVHSPNYTKFISRIMTGKEVNLMESIHLKANAAYISKRWAGKEAVAKAFGCGISGNIGFHDIEILKSPLGKPEVRMLKQNIQTPLYTGDVSKIQVHLSLSDSISYAIASVIIEEAK